jgi:sulfate-transporting ATPase
MDILQQMILGVGTGAALGLAALGLVTIFKGSGILNFAHGAIGMVGTYVYAQLIPSAGEIVALVVGVLSSAVLGALVQILVIRHLRNAATVSKVVATLGLLLAIQGGATLLFGTDQQLAPSPLPNGAIKAGAVSVPYSSLIILIIGIVVTVALHLYYRRTVPGLATEASSIDENDTSRLGYRTDLLAMGTWALGSGLAGLTGILLVAQTGLNQTTLTLVVISAFAAVLVGGFRAIIPTFIGALLIGVAQSGVSDALHRPGVKDAIPFLVVVIVLLIRNDAIPSRVASVLREHLPIAPRSKLRPVQLVITVAIAIALPFVLGDFWTPVLTQAFGFAIVGLSIVLLAGFLGQISLAQWAFAGIGALLGGSLLANAGWPVLAVLAFVLVVSFVIGLILGYPALRIRGLALAVVTLGAASALKSVWFDQVWSIAAVELPQPSVFGYQFTIQDVYFAALGVVVVLGVGLLLLRRSRVGSMLLAVRASERAAAASGINVRLVKLLTFGVAGAMAALGGVVFAYGAGAVNAQTFGALQSVILVAVASLVGLGVVSGGLSVAGAVLIPQILLQFGVDQVWFSTVAGLLVVVHVIVRPDGTLATIARIKANRLAARIGTEDTKPSTDHESSEPSAALEVGR